MVKHFAYFGISALVIGILSLFIIPGILGIVTIILAGIGLSKQQKYSLIALILGIISTLGAVIMVLYPIWSFIYVIVIFLGLLLVAAALFERFVHTGKLWD